MAPADPKCFIDQAGLTLASILLSLPLRFWDYMSAVTADYTVVTFVVVVVVVFIYLFVEMGSCVSQHACKCKV